jgi:hypothetical protein
MKGNKLFTFALFLVAVFFAVANCAPVFAADLLPAPTAAAAPDSLTTFLRQSVFPVIGALFMGILTLFLTRIGQKYKIDALTQRNNIVEQLAYQGITKAEELAAQFVGSKALLSGGDKLSIAVSHILAFMPSVTKDQAESMVHALLAQIPGTGASGNMSIASPGLTLGSLAFAGGLGAAEATPLPVAAAAA